MENVNRFEMNFSKTPNQIPMLKKTSLIIVAILLPFMANLSQAQMKSLTGNGEVFYHEEFDWADPTDERGWSLPEGFSLIDHDDIGYNWMWMAPDSVVAEWTAEPVFRSTSSHNGYLVNPLNLYNTPEEVFQVNNDIEFPLFDCSSKSSVILRFETHFMNGGDGANEVWVSNDDGIHWAVFDCGFGTQHKDRPNDAAPGDPVIYEANISDVAAGASEVIIRIHWGECGQYFWVVDDFTLSEAFDNDLQITHFGIEWIDDNENKIESFIHDIPISQTGLGSFGNFIGAVQNFGENDQDNLTMTVDIKKNHQSVYTGSDSRSWISPGIIDTLLIEDVYTPTEFGHYSIDYYFSQDQEEEKPADNGAQIFFNVTDSVYSRADESSELTWAYGFEYYGGETGEAGWNIGHFVGMIYPIYGDCEVSSISTFITGGLADGKIEFWYTLYRELTAEEDPDGEVAIELLSTELVLLDSAQFNTWVTLPFDKDGETEFLMAGDVVYAGISYNNYNDEPKVRRSKNIAIGHDASIKVNDPISIGYLDGTFHQYGFIAKRNLMIRLNLNDQSNIIDGVDLYSTLVSLGQNYPNPFTQTTSFDYELASASEVKVIVKDITGRQVLEMNEGFKPAGVHQVVVDGSQLQSGLYFYTIRAGQLTETRQMVVQ